MVKLTLMIAAVWLSCAAGVVHAQAWPSKPIRFLISFAPGGFTDTLARTLGERMARAWGQPVLADNRPGAAGVIAAELLVKSPPDGHTLLMVSAAFAINATLQPKLPYDSVRDIAPVALLAELPNILVVHPSVPAKSVAELIALARRHPGKLMYASAGVGSTQHLSGELFRAMTGTDLVHVPYKGGAPAVLDLLAGHVHLTFGSTVALGAVRAGRLRALAVTTARRNPALPDVPTIAEAGVPGYEAAVWYAVLTNAGVSRDIVERVAAEARRFVEDPAERERFREQTAELRWMGPDELGAFISAEIKRWGEVVRRSGAKPE
jgi:tripartite-type tricarboxylate transporter receptor subunit TctC